MKRLFSKLKRSSSNNKATEPTDTSFTDAIINAVDGTPFALSESNVLYAGLSELAGYHYFKTIIIGTFKTKTFKGAKLIVNGQDFKLELNSDMLELTSETSKVPNRNITQIDFEIDEADLPKISKTTIESLEIVDRKNHLKFKTIAGHFVEEITDKALMDNTVHEPSENKEDE